MRFQTSPTYGSLFDMMKAQGISYRLAGDATVDHAHTSLMNSPGHRANILNSGFSKVGIGIIKGDPYGLMISQEFIG
ncbi:CAP domain-containing protein [Sporomusa carbonis]|uniref:CAP domain-containing protein n=1 Tax=Sporomusa carbonis TaxID=3076075 RepID=UPI003C7C8C03